VTNSNKMTQEHIEHILAMYSNKEEVNHVSRVVSISEVAENDYNLSVSTYVEKEDTREKVDITVLNKEIEEIVRREEQLRLEIDKIIAEIEGSGNE
ncbi:MAG: N-6 DNA methylase, partial [Bacteroidales bacterium]